jgi:hypothetical protein
MGRIVDPSDTIAMQDPAEGKCRRGIGRGVGVPKDTVYAWLDCAGRHGPAVTASRFDQSPSTDGRLDGWWSFVWKKAAPLAVAEKALARSAKAIGART